MPDHFTIENPADGLFACIEGTSGAAVSNAAIVDLGDKAIVIDTFQTATAAAELRETVTELTGKSAFLVVNSHWHSDHVGGNQVFDDLPIVGTPRMAELIVANTPADLEAWAAEVDGYLETFRARLESDDERERTVARRRLATLDHIREGIPGFRLALPDLQIEERLVVEGEQRVEVICAGTGHTESDLFVWLPETAAVVAGDLAWNRIHPRTWDGEPRAWAESVEQIIALGPRQVIPGHGRAGDAGLLEGMAAYMRQMAEAVDAVRQGVVDPSAVAVPSGSQAWQGEERFREGLQRLAAR